MNTLEQQILNCFPSGKYALTGLLRLVEIKESDQVQAAGVERKAQPRLLINPAFVERHAETPEKLFMLVMHELHHVLLGHTQLPNNLTPLDCFVFDCVVNAMISRMFPKPEYLRFLTDLYPDRKFPECMLRPPLTFDAKCDLLIPAAIQDLPPDAGKRFEEVYRALYSEAMVSYDEIRHLFSGLDESAMASIPLLSGHPEFGEQDASSASPQGQPHGIEEDNGDDGEPHSAALRDILRETASKWPFENLGRSLNDLLREATVTPRPVPGNRAILRNLLARLGDRANGRNVRSTAEIEAPLPTALPRLERRTAVLRALGGQPMFYSGQVKRLRKTRTGSKVHVYVDVSGSMDSVLRAIYGAVGDCRAWVHTKVHTFSTVVQDLTLNEFQSGHVETTGGTSIDCVAEHMATHKISRACIVTDGMVGEPEGACLETLMRAKIGVALAGQHIDRGSLAEVADRVVELNTP